MKYTKSELDEAKTALTSALLKCEKIDENKKLGKSQQTLLDRRIRALRLALNLIENEIHCREHGDGSGVHTKLCENIAS